MADIGPIAGAIYANQQMASVASEKSALLNRFELQQLAAAAVASEEKKEVQEVRPAEENQGVDPDREHTKEQAEQEEQRSKKENNSPHEKTKSLHLLDIKV